MEPRLLEHARKAIAKHGSTPPPCDNCRHPYGEHNGRSLGWEERRPDGGRIWRSSVGPPDRFAWGRTCSHLMDSYHTCSCSEWAITVDGVRVTQRLIEKMETYAAAGDDSLPSDVGLQAESR